MVIKIVLDAVVDFERSVVTKILDVVLVVAPIRFVKAVGHVLVVPKIVYIAPILIPICPEVVELPLIGFAPVVPVLLAIRISLVSLRRKVFSPLPKVTTLQSSPALATPA